LRTADIKASNRKHRDERLNRGIQGFLFSTLQVCLSPGHRAEDLPCMQGVLHQSLTSL
jgi:hypothetical protein